jgi:hypothetical protein
LDASPEASSRSRNKLRVFEKVPAHYAHGDEGCRIQGEPRAIRPDAGDSSRKR